MSALDLMNMTCTLTAPTWARGVTTGFMVPTYGSGTSGVKCSIQPSRTWQGNQAHRETGVTDYDVYLDPSATVDVDYRITSVAGTDGYAGVWASKTLVVTSLYADAAGRGTYLRVTAQLVEDGPTV